MGDRSGRHINAAIIGAAFLALPAGFAFAADIKGSITESVMYTTDDASKQSYSYTISRLKLDTVVSPSGGNSLHFDGSYRGAGQNDYNSVTPVARVDAANYKFDKLFSGTDLILGRQQIDSFVGSKVDGALFLHHTSETSGFGLFGGTAPDPYTDAFTTGFTTYGAYGYIKERKAGATAGYATTLFNGKEDQAYIFGSTYYATGESLSTAVSLRLDHNITGAGYDITDLNASANYRWGMRSGLGLDYSQYRGLWYQQSEAMAYSNGLDLQRSIRVNGDFSVGKLKKFYADYDYRVRDSDNGVASLLTLGYKDASLPRGFFYNVAYRNMDYFYALSWQAYFAAGKELSELATAEISAAYALNSGQPGMSNDMSQMIYTATVNWLISKSFYFNCAIEYSDQQFISVDSVYLAKYADGFKTTSVYATLRYRF